MGCDIHMVLEKNDEEFGWVGISNFENYDGFHEDRPLVISRNYRRFAALAGVRGDGPKPKGIPGDVSPLTQLGLKEWKYDAHSHSWLPLSEAVPIFKKRFYEAEKPIVTGSFEDEWPASYWFNVDDNEIEKYRLIFWFDN